MSITVIVTLFSSYAWCNRVLQHRMHKYALSIVNMQFVKRYFISSYLMYRLPPFSTFLEVTWSTKKSFITWYQENPCGSPVFFLSEYPWFHLISDRKLPPIVSLAAFNDVKEFRNNLQARTSYGLYINIYTGRIAGICSCPLLLTLDINKSTSTKVGENNKQ